MGDLPEELHWLYPESTLTLADKWDLCRLRKSLSRSFSPIRQQLASLFLFCNSPAGTEQREAVCPYTIAWLRRLCSGSYDLAFWEEQIALGAQLARSGVPRRVLSQAFTLLRTCLLEASDWAPQTRIRPLPSSVALRVLDACQSAQQFGLERERHHTVVRQLRDLLQEFDFAAFFEKAAQLACAIAEADGAGLIVHKEGKLQYRLFHGLSVRYRDLEHWEFPATEGVSGAALAREEPIYLPDYPHSPWAMAEFVLAGLQSSLAIPLARTAEETPGILVISWFQQPGPLRIPEDSWDHLRLLADLLGANLYRERLEQRMEGLAVRDLLTNLLNRRALQERLRAAMARCDRHHRLLAIFFLDLDGFKPVNDQLGHHRGDDVLCTIAGQLCAVVRTEDCVIRYAGDEFVVLVEDIANVEEVEAVAARIVQAAQCTITAEQTQLQVSASMGAVIYPFSEGGAEDLTRQADLAMYAAKELGGNTWKLYGRDLIDTQQPQEPLYQELCLAQQRQEFELFWQPIVELTDHTVTGAEALLYWRHPERGLLGPEHFLPNLERSRMILEVGRWVLDTALAQAESWQNPENLLDIHINLSAVQLEEASFSAFVQAELARHPKISPARVWLQVVERVALRDIPATAAVIQRCRRLGVHFTLDDYRSGITALGYLSELACAGIKLDQDVMRDLVQNTAQVHHVRTMMDVASGLSLEVVAKGVENEQAADLLRDLGIRKAQGYWFSPPIPAVEMSTLLAR